MHREPVVTEILILRKTPYQDSRTIFSGISPQYGRVTAMLRIPQGGSRSNYRHGDIFQQWSMTFNQNSAEVVTCSRWELLREFSAVAARPDAFEAACWMARFVLTNTVAGAPLPELYRAVYVALTRLAEGRIPPEAVLTGVGLTYLREGGWLAPEYMSPDEAPRCELLLRMAAGGDTPALTADNWKELWQWTLARLAAADCDIAV